ncbi:HD-GYP domain-containing protein [Marispirochaeta sp.]|jgi:HD-GYP domain-containing protein (c-di-GMP phosphodiesterase class II)|uniref:HD-GYP domain-containing protein n=1 Tax=Marispirochaeta sp. TaxID=2038653 RepID=UPI0029C61CAE|nr:HD-GYP domain-containing protein [Marispirochaeta sp.]
MKNINVDDLKAGMKFDQPVYIDGENILVPAEIRINEKDIARLRKWEIESVQTAGSLIDEEEERKTKEKTIKDLKESQSYKELLQIYLAAVKQINILFATLRQGRRVTTKELNKVAELLYQTVKRAPTEMTGITIRADKNRQGIAVSSVNCAILAMVTGMNLKLDDAKLHSLVLGALLHDVGMLKMPDAILNKSGDLHESELKTIYTHTVHSYNIITKELGYPEEIGLIALQHHERWDGKGYPHKISGDQIYILARVVSLVDSFEAMVRDKPYRDSMIGYSAMRQILNDNSRRFDSSIVKVFLKSMGIYPLGSVVILNDGSIGSVVRTHASVPLRPVIRILMDSDGNRFDNNDGETIDLLETKTLFIVRAINPQELGKRRENR